MLLSASSAADMPNSWSVDVSYKASLYICKSGEERGLERGDWRGEMMRYKWGKGERMSGVSKKTNEVKRDEGGESVRCKGGERGWVGSSDGT